MSTAEDTRELAAPVKVAVWGPSESGKSVLLASLDCAQHEGWDISVQGDVFRRLVLQPLTRNRPPKPTQVTTAAGANTVVCSFYKPGAPPITAEIEDRAGEEWERAAGDDASDGKGVSLDILAGSNAAVLLYDLEASNDAENMRRVQGICRRIKKLWQGRDTNPLAVCMTKCDQKLTEPEQVLKAKADPEGMIRDILQPERFETVVKMYRSYFENVKFFPVSSLGLRMVYGAIAPVTFYDEQGELAVVSGTREERNSWQINLTEPFVWIFKMLGLS
jgi:GTPase SAR1 family protein